MGFDCADFSLLLIGQNISLDYSTMAQTKEYES